MKPPGAVCIPYHAAILAYRAETVANFVSGFIEDEQVDIVDSSLQCLILSRTRYYTVCIGLERYCKSYGYPLHNLVPLGKGLFNLACGQ